MSDLQRDDSRTVEDPDADGGRWQCPRCNLVYAVSGPPTENPGGLGAKTGWTCIPCVDEAPRHIQIQFGIAMGSPFAACWHPVYLIPYEGDEETDLELWSKGGWHERQFEEARKASRAASASLKTNTQNPTRS